MEDGLKGKPQSVSANMRALAPDYFCLLTCDDTGSMKLNEHDLNSNYLTLENVDNKE